MHNDKKVKLIIVFTVLVDVVGIGIVIPILPYYVSSFSASPMLITSLFAVYSLCSFFSAPLLGSLSDRIGRRPVLIISILSTAMGWIVFASAHSIFWLFIGRIVDGLAAGNLSTAQSTLTDISKTDKERTSNLGIIGALFGIGFIMGPFIGGMLSAITPSLAFYFVGFVALINSVSAFFFLPETHPNVNKNESMSFNPLGPLIRAYRNKKARRMFLVWFFFGIALAIFQSIFALYLKDKFGLTVSQTGILMTVMGVIMVFNQVWLLKHFWLRLAPELKLIKWLLAFFGIALFCMGSGIWVLFLIGILLNIFTHSVLRAIITSQAIALSPSERKGEVLGVMNSIVSLSMIAGPIMAGWMFQTRQSLPFFLAGAWVGVAFVVSLCCAKRSQKTVTA